MALLEKIRVLYVGSLGRHDTSTHRCAAIGRLGNAVFGLDVGPYANAGGPLLSRVRIRTLIGPAVSRLNNDILRIAIQYKPDVAWFDKPVYVYPDTIRKLRNIGIYTVDVNYDNPFGPRGDPGWRLFLKGIPEYDLHLVPRDVNLSDYRRAGARDVDILRLAYEPLLHFPPPVGWSDKDRTHDVVFIGSPYDNRREFLLDLFRSYNIRVLIWGGRWDSMLSASERKMLLQGNGLFNKDYREGIWKAKMCLSFVTHSNCDEVAHKSFEIAACQGFLLAEDTAGHRAHFRGNEEAVFFNSVQECAERIRALLPDEAARARIAAAARLRSESSGYSNDSRIGAAFEYIAERRRVCRQGKHGSPAKCVVPANQVNQ